MGNQSAAAELHPWTEGPGEATLVPCRDVAERGRDHERCRGGRTKMTGTGKRCWDTVEDNGRSGQGLWLWTTSSHFITVTPWLLAACLLGMNGWVSAELAECARVAGSG